jgi:hypothetical protein
MSATASRPPDSTERADIVRAVLIRLETDSPSVTIHVNRVVVATKQPRARSKYSVFAAAHALGRDGTGHLVGSPLTALVGYSRRFRTWVTITYGSDQVGCGAPQLLFGGRRAAILRDLGLGCA